MNSCPSTVVPSSISNPRVICCPPSTKHGVAQYRNSSPLRLFFHQPVVPVTKQSTTQRSKGKLVRFGVECRDNEQENQLVGLGAKSIHTYTTLKFYPKRILYPCQQNYLFYTTILNHIYTIFQLKNREIKSCSV
jgi:hypothetical protein